MPPRKKIVICRGCEIETPHYARGYCETCYARQLRKSKKEHEVPVGPEEDVVEKWLTC